MVRGAIPSLNIVYRVNMRGGAYMSKKNSFYVDILSLGVTQIYLSSRKIDALLQWFHPAGIDTYGPLPVYDFGDGLRLTDGHTRAYVAYRMGVKSVPVIVDSSEMVTSALGRKLYLADIVWAKRYGVNRISDLMDRVVAETEYDRLWKRRCDRSYQLLSQVDEAKLASLQRESEGLFLYGASENLSEFYYEDASSNLYVLKKGELLRE